MILGQQSGGIGRDWLDKGIVEVVGLLLFKGFSSISSNGPVASLVRANKPFGLSFLLSISIDVGKERLLIESAVPERD